MAFRRAVETTGTSIFLFVTAALIATGCSSPATTSGTGGGPGSGGRGSGGRTGAGGTGVGGSVVDAGFNLCQNTLVMTPILNDFTMGAGFGFDGSNPAGTFYDPYGGPGPVDYTNMNAHVTGTVSGYAGLQVVFTSCNADASQGSPPYTGIQFKIGGTVSPTGQMQFLVSTGADYPALDVPSIETHHAGCQVVTNQYVDCLAPSATFTVPATATTTALTTIQLPWSRFAGGKPKGNVDVNDITGLTFIFPWNPNVDGGGVAYPVDLVIDDFGFIQAGSGGDDASTD